MDGAVTVPDLLSKDTASVTDTPPRDVNFNGLVQMSDQPPKQVGLAILIAQVDHPVAIAVRVAAHRILDCFPPTCAV